MKKINEYLHNYPGKKTSDDMIDRLLEDPIIRNFVMKHDLKHETISSGINNLLSFKESKDICNQCTGLYDCKLITTGMTPTLRYYQNDVILEFTKCKYNTSDDSKLKIDSMYVPRKVFNADFSDFDLVGKERKEIHNYIIRFLKEYSRDHPMKGMYLSGIFGSGKTYILAAMANELAKLGYEIIFAYYPDLVRELKSSIGSGDLEDKIERLKRVDILFLDDIGGEAPSQFIRDEVLGPILQHRVLDELPTFFSSNLKMKVLLEAMQNDNSIIEKTKSSRIYERIKELSIEFEISEKPTHLS
ncbi:MAG: primosomal protein DnaI [Firmicutes bacterium]|nr:primosomal protein DnaI [Bacillota bacterium]